VSQRVRIRYAKDGKARFVSARDVASVWERAIRRAGLPIAYSEGYSPHPKVSFPDALPVGVASTGEYAELTFTGAFDLADGMAALSATLPVGMRILTYQPVPDGSPKLSRALEATLWEVVHRPDEHGRDDDQAALLSRLGEAVLAAEEAPVVRTKPDGTSRTIDLRPGLVAIHAELAREIPTGPPAPTLRVILRNDGPQVRPGDLTTALLVHRAPDDPQPPEPRLLRRVVQGRLAGDAVAEALSGEVVPLASGGSPGKRAHDERPEDRTTDRGRRAGGSPDPYPHPGSPGAADRPDRRGRRIEPERAISIV
jgi:radical SAM-linked protein